MPKCLAFIFILSPDYQKDSTSARLSSHFHRFIRDTTISLLVVGSCNEDEITIASLVATIQTSCSGIQRTLLTLCLQISTSNLHDMDQMGLILFVRLDFGTLTWVGT
jgi:hypothetical protein